MRTEPFDLDTVIALIGKTFNKPSAKTMMKTDARAIRLRAMQDAAEPKVTAPGMEGAYQVAASLVSAADARYARAKTLGNARFNQLAGCRAGVATALHRARTQRLIEKRRASLEALDAAIAEVAKPLPRFAEAVS